MQALILKPTLLPTKPLRVQAQGAYVCNLRAATRHTQKKEATMTGQPKFSSLWWRRGCRKIQLTQPVAQAKKPLLHCQRTEKLNPATSNADGLENAHNGVASGCSLEKACKRNH